MLRTIHSTSTEGPESISCWLKCIMKIVDIYCLGEGLLQFYLWARHNVCELFAFREIINMCVNQST